MRILFTLSLFLVQLLVIAQGSNVLIRESIQLEQGFNETAALEKLKQVLRTEPNNYYALWKSSELYSRLGISQTDKQKMLVYYRAAQKSAEHAIRVQPNDADGYYVLSVAMGRLALAGPNKEKIAAVKAIKSNAEKALKLNPNHGRAWHVLGKWHYEISGLNFVERTAVKLFYGGFPESSYQLSVQAYERAQRLEANFALNYLELAKAYHQMDQDAKARSLLQKLAGLPNRTGDDQRIKAEGKALMAELN